MRSVHFWGFRIDSEHTQHILITDKQHNQKKEHFWLILNFSFDIIIRIMKNDRDVIKIDTKTPEMNRSHQANEV